MLPDVSSTELSSAFDSVLGFELCSLFEEAAELELEAELVFFASEEAVFFAVEEAEDFFSASVLLSVFDEATAFESAAFVISAFVAAGSVTGAVVSSTQLFVITAENLSILPIEYEATLLSDAASMPGARVVAGTISAVADTRTASTAENAFKPLRFFLFVSVTFVSAPFTPE